MEDVINNRKKPENFEKILSDPKLKSNEFEVNDDLVLFNINELNRAIKSLMNGKTPAIEPVKNEDLKGIDQENRVKLLEIFNNLYLCGEVPKEWKEGIMTIIYKGKGKKNSLTNYRGITVSSSIAKTMEKLIKERRLKHYFEQK